MESKLHTVKPSDKKWVIFGAIPIGVTYTRVNEETKKTEVHKSQVGHAMVGLGWYDSEKKTCNVEVFGNWPINSGFSKMFEWSTTGLEGVEGKMVSDVDLIYHKQAVYVFKEINTKQFNSARRIKAEWERMEHWQLLKKDCVNYMQDVAIALGFKTPTRLLNPFPFSYMQNFAYANKLPLYRQGELVAKPQPTPIPKPTPTPSSGSNPGTSTNPSNGYRDFVHDREPSGGFGGGNSGAGGGNAGGGGNSGAGGGNAGGGGNSGGTNSNEGGRIDYFDKDGNHLGGFGLDAIGDW